MAKHSLDLQFNGAGDGAVGVSWNDTVLGSFSETNKAGYNIGMGLALVGMLLGLAISIVVVIISTIALIFFAYMATMGTSIERREVVIGKEETRFKGRIYPTAQISRFEYAPRSQWTGNPPKVNKNGVAAPDPTEIRMWLNDDVNVVVGVNNWQPQVNVQIRNALDNALRQIRKVARDAEREEKLGKEGDFGVPDY